MEKPIKNKKPIILKTPQSIVHIKHTISLRQYKYWVLLLRFYREFFESGEEPDKKGFYSVPIAKISDYMGYEPMKTELKTDFGVLRREPIIINFLDKDGKRQYMKWGLFQNGKLPQKPLLLEYRHFLKR